MPKDEISEEVKAGWRKMKPTSLSPPKEEAHRRFLARHTSKTREVSFYVDADFLTALQSRIGAKSVAEVLQEALAMLDWASSERDKGRFVLSTDEHGGESV